MIHLGFLLGKHYATKNDKEREDKHKKLAELQEKISSIHDLFLSKNIINIIKT